MNVVRGAWGVVRERTGVGRQQFAAPNAPRVALHATYHDAFLTPGIIPDSDSSRKQIRHKPKRRRYARERPHRPHRLCTRTLNFGFRLLFSIMALRAIWNSLSMKVGTARHERQVVERCGGTIDRRSGTGNPIAGVSRLPFFSS